MSELPPELVEQAARACAEEIGGLKWDELAPQSQELERVQIAEVLSVLLEQGHIALPATLAAGNIERVLREEAWEGRWNPSEYANVAPCAAHTAEVLARAMVQDAT